MKKWHKRIIVFVLLMGMANIVTNLQGLGFSDLFTKQTLTISKIVGTILITIAFSYIAISLIYNNEKEK